MFINDRAVANGTAVSSVFTFNLGIVAVHEVTTDAGVVLFCWISQGSRLRHELPLGRLPAHLKPCYRCAAISFHTSVCCLLFACKCKGT